MIEISAVATHEENSDKPICLTVYAQGQMSELNSFAERVGMAMIIPNWNGRPLAAAEILIKSETHSYAKVLTLFQLIEQRGEVVKWITSFVPGIPTAHNSMNNSYSSRDEFMAALKAYA